MRFTVTEWHQVASIKTYEIDESDAEEIFGSMQRLREIISHQDQQMWGGMEPEGDEPTEEESDSFWEYTHNSDYDREDDWWTDRKGGYDVTVKVEED